MGVYEQSDAQRILDSCVAVENALESGEVPWVSTTLENQARTTLEK
jgi:hypothetical protein